MESQLYHQKKNYAHKVLSIWQQLFEKSLSAHLYILETVDIITQIPTVWDETIVLEAAVSDYIVVARRSGEDWYLGAMTDWEPRDFDIALSFLNENTDYSVQIFKDGINADRNAMDYKVDEKTMSSTTPLQIHMSSGGGFSAIFTKK